MAGDGGGSTSMVFAEEATGFHVFKVQGYSQYRAAADVGHVVTSGTFTVGGHSWCVLYFPNGYTGRENAGWVGFGLQHVSCFGGVVTAQISLCLLDKDGAPLMPSTSYTTVSRLWNFSRYEAECCCGQFIRFQAFDSIYLKEDCFRIRCDLTVILKTRDESVEPPPELHRHLGNNMLATGVGGDVTFEVGKETFVAHKNVLAARSPVFMAEFFGGKMDEKQAAARVRIHGIDARAFKAMLHFIYTDSLPETYDDDKVVVGHRLVAEHLLVAAYRYGIERLKPICESKLCLFVDASAAVPTLRLAEKHGFRLLKEACFRVLKQGVNLKALGYNDFSYLQRRCPSLLDELLAHHGL